MNIQFTYEYGWAFFGSIFHFVYQLTDVKKEYSISVMPIIKIFLIETLMKIIADKYDMKYLSKYGILQLDFQSF